MPDILRERDGEPVAPELGPLLLAVYAELGRRASDHGHLRTLIERLLIYLGSAAGRTNANCWAVDLFLCLQEGWDEDISWEHVPADLGDILSDMAGALHDTVQSPGVTESLDATPELLLARLRRADISSGAA